VRQVAVQYRPAWQQEGGRIVHAPLAREVAVAEEVAQALALAEPVLVEAGDGQRVRHIDLVDEVAHGADDVLHPCQAGHVERRAALSAAMVRPLAAARVVGPDADRRGRAADDEIRMRVLAAEDRVQCHGVALPDQCIKIVGDGHQVGLGRQAIGRMAPVAVAEDAELSAVDEALEFLLHVGEVARRGFRVTADRLRQLRGGLGIGFQRRDNVHPVQCVQVVEVHHVVVNVLRAYHQVADQLGIGRHRVAQRAFHGADRGNAMHHGAYATDALGQRPGVARVAPAQDDLQAAYHGAGGIGFFDTPVGHAGFDAQVAFDARDGIENQAFRHLTKLQQGWLQISSAASHSVTPREGGRGAGRVCSPMAWQGCKHS
jgi:hypothetical protein